MIVYVVSQGMNYEGSNVIGVRQSFEDARKLALQGREHWHEMGGSIWEEPVGGGFIVIETFEAR